MNNRKAALSHRISRASTSDILSEAGPRKPRVPLKWREYFKRLTMLRDVLQHRQEDLTRDAQEETPNFSIHMADAGTDTFDRDLALSMLSSEQDALYQVEQAIDRIRQGTYGKCELTGRPIERGRLEAIPWTRFSIRAERALENEGIRKRAALQHRHPVSRSEPGFLDEGEEKPEES